MADVNVTDLTQETYNTLDGSEQFVMFDTVEGKRATIAAVGEYVLKKLIAMDNKTLQTILSEKVDVVTGKGLSANDFTNALKDKLDGIKSGAQVNVQSDWSEADNTSDAFIKNKPTIPPAVTVDNSLSDTSTNPVQNKVLKGALDGKVNTVTGKGLSANDFTTTYKEKLDNISNGAEVNQNAFSNVKVGATTIEADAKTDTLELAAGANVTLTPDTSSDKVTIAATDTTYESKAASSGGTALSLVTTGEKYTWNNKIGSHQTIKQDGVTGATVNRFGTCDVAASIAAKTVSITTGTFSLEAGARISVKFTYANTASTPTLNVNSKGAKNIFHNGSMITSGDNKALLAGVVDFIYDGTQWHLIGNYVDTNTTYTGTSPISVSGGAISLENSGVSAASRGDTTNQTPGFGQTFKVPSGTVDAKGRLTAFADHTVTIPNATATTESAGLMSATDKTAVDKIGDTTMGTTATTLTGAIAEHEQDISDLYSNNTVSSSIVYGKCCHVLKRSGFVTVHGQSTGDYQISNSYSALTTIPTAYRPPETVYFTGNALGGNEQVFGYVDANGVVYLFATSATKYWAYSVSFPTSY